MISKRTPNPIPHRVSLSMSSTPVGDDDYAVICLDQSSSTPARASAGATQRLDTMTEVGVFVRLTSGEAEVDLVQAAPPPDDAGLIALFTCYVPDATLLIDQVRASSSPSTSVSGVSDPRRELLYGDEAQTLCSTHELSSVWVEKRERKSYVVGFDRTLVVEEARSLYSANLARAVERAASPRYAKMAALLDSLQHSPDIYAH